MTNGTDQRVAQLRLRIQAEKQSIDNAKSQLQSVQAQFKDFKQASESANVALEHQVRAIQQQRAAAAASGQATSQFTAAQRNAANAADQVSRALRSQKQAQDAANASAKAAGGPNLLQNIGSQIYRLPSQQLGGGISTDVIGRLFNTLGGLGTAGTAAAAGLGAAVIALKASTAGIEQTVKSIIATQDEYYRALKTGSHESIQAAIEQKRIEIEITRARIDEYRTLFQNLESQVGIVGRGIADALDLGGARQLREETQNLEAQLRALEFGMGRLQQAAGSLEVATRDAAEAEKKLAEERQKIVDQRIQTQLSAELDAAKQSSAAIQSRIADLNREQAAILAIARAGEASDELLNTLTERSRDISTIIEVLQTALPEAQARERIQSMIDGIKAIPGAVKDATTSLEKVRDSFRALTELRDEFRSREAEIRAREAESITKAETDRRQALADAEASAKEARAKLQLDREREERNHAQRLLEITRRANASISLAIQDRNAVALDAARQSRDEAKAEEATRAAEAQRALKEREDDINASLKKQNQVIERRYREQIDTAQKTATKALQTEFTKYQKELQVRQQAAQAALQVESFRRSQEAQIATAGAGQILSIGANLWSTLAQQARTAASAVQQRPANVTPIRPTPTTPTPYVPPGTRVPTLATGGYVNRDGIAYLHTGEYVVNPRRNGVTLAPTFQLTGVTRRELKRSLDKAFSEFLDDMFA